MDATWTLQGADGALGEFDMSSGCCLATAELRSTPSNLAYSMDGRLLVVLLQVRIAAERPRRRA